MEKHDFLKLLTLVLILLTIGGIFIIYSIHREAIIAHALTLLDESNLEGDSFNDSIPDEEAAGPNRVEIKQEPGHDRKKTTCMRSAVADRWLITFDDGPSINTGPFSMFWVLTRCRPLFLLSVKTTRPKRVSIGVLLTRAMFLETIHIRMITTTSIVPGIRS